MTVRCCVCRHTDDLEPVGDGSPLQGIGTELRCSDRDACRQRVRDVVRAHQALAEMCDDKSS